MVRQYTSQSIYRHVIVGYIIAIISAQPRAMNGDGGGDKLSDDISSESDKISYYSSISATNITRLCNATTRTTLFTRPYGAVAVIFVSFIQAFVTDCYSVVLFLFEISTIRHRYFSSCKNEFGKIIKLLNSEISRFFFFGDCGSV